jgi:hypothetical protein
MLAPDPSYEAYCEEAGIDGKLGVFFGTGENCKVRKMGWAVCWRRQVLALWLATLPAHAVSVCRFLLILAAVKWKHWSNFGFCLWKGTVHVLLS